MTREELEMIPHAQRRNYDQVLSRWVPERRCLTLSEACQVLTAELYDPKQEYSCFETMQYFGFRTIFDLVIYLPKKMYLGVDDQPLEIAPQEDRDAIVRTMNLGLPLSTRVLWGKFIKRESIMELDKPHFKTTIDYMMGLDGFVPTWPNLANAILLYCDDLESIDRRFCQPDRSQLYFTSLGEDLSSLSGSGIIIVSIQFINRCFKARIDNNEGEEGQTSNAKKSYVRTDCEFEPIANAISRTYVRFKRQLEEIALERETLLHI